MIELLEADFVRAALQAAVLIGVILSLLGVYVVLRRIIFVGMALAQVSAAGVAFSILVAGLAAGAGFGGAAHVFAEHPETLAIVATLLGAILLSVRPKRVSVPSEGAIGVGYALASSLAILVIAKAPGGEADTLSLMYGNILAVKPVERLELSLLCPIVILIHILFRKEFMMVSLSPEMARAAGVPVPGWNLFLYGMLGVGIASGIRVAGSLLAFSYLVLPALAGVMVGRKAWHVPAVAVASAVVGSVGGIVCSVAWDLPSGPTIVAVLVAETGIAWAIARFLH